jgi:hypothetical protein
VRSSKGKVAQEKLWSELMEELKKGNSSIIEIV